MTKREISRRKFVGYSAAVGSAAVLGARAVEAVASPGAAAPVSASAGQDMSSVKYAKVIDTVPAAFQEAPMLAEMAAAGTIPPLAERLPEPEDILVVEPIEIGQYGGEMRVGDMSTNLGGYDIGWASGGPNHFLRYNPELTGTEPNLATSVDVSEDKTTYTIHMRRGMKWSDGQPVTSADMMFLYEDWLLNKELTPVVALEFRPGDKVMEVTAPDEYTIQIKFAVPHPRFLLSHMGHYYGWWAGELFPRHYLEKFHPKYNPNAAQEAKDAGFSTWMERFNDMNSLDNNMERPSYHAMIAVESTPTLVRYQRNPYYWAVDSQGNQLPYLDGAVMERLQDIENYHAKIVTGAFDFAAGNTSVLNFATYEASAQQGGYRVLRWSSGRGGENFYQVNLNWPDAELRTIHQDVRYRQAMSLAINRQEMNDLLFFGSAVPRQMTVLPTSIYFKQEYADAFAQYDVDQANALLDELGLAWNGDRTARLLPSGKPLKYAFDYFNGEGPKQQILELVSEYWRAVGIDVVGTPVTRQLLGPRVDTNKEPMSMWHGDASTDILLPVDRKWVTGKAGDECTIAPLWNAWWETEGAEGEEPAEWYLEALNTWREFSETLDPAIADKLLQSQADNLWSIGTVGMTPWPIIVKNTIGNVPETGIHTWDGHFQYPYHPETYF
ncbi:MAG TPA: ABC transporter substrate-binding protein, partial [Thermomicrobiales bacterium]|nr:ABC transporter substrate-binding protein [Thermomicrobiales bacterium]